MKVKSIKETCIYVKDLERCQTFYGNIIGLAIMAKAEGRHIFFLAGSSVLLCFIAESTLNEKILPPHGATGSIHFAFEVTKEDYLLYKYHLSSQGIQILHEHDWGQGKRSFYIHDPDQNLVEFIVEGLWEKR
jgi:catechol-2,3-dioxygenase